MQLLLENLTSNLLYSLRLQGSAESLYSPGLMYHGPWSESQQMRLQKDCHLVQPIILQHSRKAAIQLSCHIRHYKIPLLN